MFLKTKVPKYPSLSKSIKNIANSDNKKRFHFSNYLKRSVANNQSNENHYKLHKCLPCFAEKINDTNTDNKFIYHKTMKSLSNSVFQAHSNYSFKYYYHYLDIKSKNNNHELKNLFQEYYNSDKERKNYHIRTEHINNFYDYNNKITKYNIFDIYLNSNTRFNSILDPYLIKISNLLDSYEKKYFYDKEFEKKFLDLLELKDDNVFLKNEIDPIIESYKNLNHYSLDRVISNCVRFCSNLNDYTIITRYDSHEPLLWELDGNLYYYNFKPIFASKLPINKWYIQKMNEKHETDDKNNEIIKNVFYIDEYGKTVSSDIDLHSTSSINETEILTNSHCLWKKFDETKEIHTNEYGSKEFKVNHFHFVQKYYKSNPCIKHMHEKINYIKTEDKPDRPHSLVNKISQLDKVFRRKESVQF